MAPREGNVLTKSPKPSSPAPEEYCGFWRKIGGLKFISSTKKIYEDSKKCGAVGTGLSAIEKGVGVASVPLMFAATKWATAYPKTAVALNSIACECLDMLEEKVPVLHKPATELVGEVKEKTNSTVKKAFRTFPGRQLLYGIDKAIDVSEKVLNVVAPAKSLPKNAEKPVEGSIIPAIFATIKKIVAWPINKCIRALRLIKRFIMSHLGLRRNLRRESTPADRRINKKQISCRRKMTPVKRLKRIGLLGRFISQFVDFVGINLSRNQKDGDIRLYLVPSHIGQDPVNVESASEKRKHEELSESESDSSLFDLDNLENYVSEDDPDYVPDEEGWSTDSFEFAEGDTESELEDDSKQPTTAPPVQGPRSGRNTSGNTTTPATTTTTTSVTTSAAPAAPTPLTTITVPTTTTNQQTQAVSPKPKKNLGTTDVRVEEGKADAEKKKASSQADHKNSPKTPKSQASKKDLESKSKLDAKPVPKWGPEGNDTNRKGKDGAKV